VGKEPDDADKVIAIVAVAVDDGDRLMSRYHGGDEGRPCPRSIPGYAQA
jgi:hypothetical protein